MQSLVFVIATVYIPRRVK